VEVLAVPVLLVVGSLLALQAAANVQLSAAIGSPVGASALQLGLGAAVLVAAALAVGALDTFAQLGRVEPWHLAGGLGSAVYITAGILLFPRLGAVVTIGLFITGQMLTSLVLDGAGLLGVPRDPVTPGAVAGAVAVLAGAALIVRAQEVARDGGPPVVPGRAGWWLLAVTAGGVLPVQGAVNARLREDLDAPVGVAAVSFLLATLAMGVVVGGFLGAGRLRRPDASGLRRLPWWGWLGGLVGAGYVVSMFLFIPEIGAAPTVALTVAGQQVAGVAVDRYGLFRLPQRPVTGLRLAGVAVLLAGVVLVQV
jgi:transporter family-2 protein